MFDLAREIRRIAEENAARKGEGYARPGAVAETRVSQAIGEFQRIGTEAVRLYNDAAGSEELWLVPTPPIVLRAFLHFDGERVGFSVLSRDRYVVFIDYPPSGVLVLGREIAPPGAKVGGKKGLLQLINLHIEGSGRELSVRDSNGSPLDPHEVVALVVRWVSRG